MVQDYDRTLFSRAKRWCKWKLLRAIQLVGFALVVLGAYPFIRPFIAAVHQPPAVMDSVVTSVGIPLLLYTSETASGARSIVFIGAGAAIVWIATSRRVF